MNKKNVKVGLKVQVKYIDAQDKINGVTAGDILTINSCYNQQTPSFINSSGTRILLFAEQLRKYKEPIITTSGTITVSLIGDGIIKQVDCGRHYRNFVKIEVNQDDFNHGYVKVQLDPYFLASECALDITDPVQFTVFKKSIRWGNGDAKDLEKDLHDIIGACNRKLELIKNKGFD